MSESRGVEAAGRTGATSPSVAKVRVEPPSDEAAPGAGGGPHDARAEGRARLALAALVCGWSLVVSVIVLRGPHAMFDLAIHEQALWLCGQGLEPFLTTRGAWMEADHVSLVAWILAPLTWSGLGAGAVLVVQTLVLGVGAVPVYEMACERLGWRLGLAFAALYLAQPALLLAAFFDVHFNTLTCTFLLFATRYAAGGGVAYWVSLLLALSCSEFTGACAALMGLVMWREGARSRGLVTAVVGVAAFVGAMAWLRHANGGQASAYTSLYAPFLIHPLAAVGALWSLSALWACARLLLPAALLPLLGWERLLPALPLLLGNLLSWRVLQHEVRAHYGAAIVPFVMWAAILGASRLTPRPRPALLVLAAVAALCLGPLLQWGEEALEPRVPALASDPRAFARDPRVFAPDASISADDTLGAHLGDRVDLYLFPNPLQPVAWGTSPQALADQSGAGLFPLSPLALRRASESTHVDGIVFLEHPQVSMPMPASDAAYFKTLLMRDPDWEREESTPGTVVFVHR